MSGVYFPRYHTQGPFSPECQGSIVSGDAVCFAEMPLKPMSAFLDWPF